MAEVLLFHHALGLTPGVRELGDRLRAGGHVVHVPDLYDGRVFDDLDEGIGYAREVGFGTLAARGQAVAEDLPSALVYAGMSLGAVPAQLLAQTRRGARGALLLHGCLPVSEFSSDWPAGVPVQVHGMEGDPFMTEEGGDLEAARALVSSTDEAELFLYPGEEHLFTDSSLSGYDEAATALLVERVLTFLEQT